ncbi:MAG: hypothetical protein KKH70_20920, partial [Gammaproteobacteria bacterium]|nr:hypothetical protein [Gammaproteobacteria bacterium]
HWTIEQCKCSKLIDQVIVSTDDQEIKEYAESLGVRVIDREYRLTLCTASHTVITVIEQLVLEGEDVDYFLTPLPTSPIRLPWDMDGLIALGLAGGYDNTATCCEQLESILYRQVRGCEHETIVWDKHNGYRVDGGGMSCTRLDWYRQYVKDIPFTDAEFDAEFENQPEKLPHLFAYVMHEWQTPELDMPEHWGIAEAVMEKCILEPLGEDCYTKYGQQDKVWIK